MANGLKKRFASAAASIKVTPEDIAAADAAPPSAPRTAPGQMMVMQGALQNAEADIERLQAQLKATTAQLEDVRASMHISLDLIDEVDGRRRKLTPEEYEELKENLGRHPLGQPITVRRKSNGRYELVAGHNRTAVFRDLGRTSIPAFVIEVADDQVEMVAFLSNLLSPALSDFEKYWNFKKLALISGLTHAAIADSTGISRPHVTRIMQFDGLPEAALNLLSQKPARLGANAALKLAKLAQEGHEANVTEAVKKLVADDTVTQEQAVALAAPKATKNAPNAAPAETVKVGKQKFCDISIRNKVIGVRFANSVSDDDAAAWAKKFAEFMKAELAKTS